MPVNKKAVTSVVSEVKALQREQSEVAVLDTMMRGETK